MSNGFETRAIHDGQAPDPATGAVVPPISLSSTFVQQEVGKHAGFEYARSGNPTRRAYEECLASLEGAVHGFAFASGMAAEDAVLRLLEPGQGVIIPDDAYGGTFRLVSKVLAPSGIEWAVADLTDLDALARDWPDGTALVWVETPTNPALTIVDILGVCAVAHERGARVVVDNTFATPFLQRPLELGADIVVHSATKYLGGHSDVVGGFAATNDPEIAERIGFLQNAVGAVPSPFDCYLVLRGIKTLAVRMERHCFNAQAVATLLLVHPAVSTVLYPGIPAHPGHEIARAADARLRRDGELPGVRWRGDRARARRPHPAVHAGGVARRGGVAHRASGPYDPRLRGRLAAGGRSRAHPSLGRDRDHRRPRRRPPPGPRRGVERRRLTPPHRACVDGVRHTPLG